MLEMLRSRRSIRRFQDKAVEDHKTEALLKSALLAPSSRGRRPWEFIVVTDRDVLGRLSLCRGNSSSFLAGAPLGIVVLADTSESDVWVEDASIAAAIVQLSAHSLGLGSCWIQVRQRGHSEKVSAGDYVKGVLGIPDNHEVECMIAIGYAAEDKKPYDDAGLPNAKIHRDRF